MNILPIPVYNNGFHVENINCIDLPIAVASGYYEYHNYYKYAFYNALFKNYDIDISTDFVDSRNIVLNKFGLSLNKHEIKNDNDLFELIEHKLSEKIPVLIVAKYKYMFFANQFNDPNYNAYHLLLITECNIERSIVVIREFIHLRQVSWPETRGEIITRLPLSTDNLKEIWIRSNKDFHTELPEFFECAFTLDKFSKPQVNTCLDVCKDWIDHHSNYKSKLINFVTHFNQNNAQYSITQLIKINAADIFDAL